MSDLVKRLRMAARHTGDLFDEAADELERLTRELEEARKEIHYLRRYGNKDCTAMADATMSQEKRKDALDRMARDADELGLDF